MTLIRLGFAFLILLSTTLFLISNIEQLGEGIGYPFLGLSIALSVLLLVLTRRWRIVTKVTVSQLLLVWFLLYILANLIFDSWDLAVVKAATIGTTGGIVFALALGYSLSFVLSDIYLVMKKNSALTGYLIVLYLGVVLLMAGHAFQTHLADARSDLFLIADRGEYQRPGNFMFIQFMLSGALVVLLYVFLDKINKLIFFTAVTLLGSTASIFMLMSQMLGSNSGLASVGGFFVMILIFLYVAKASGLKEGFLRIGLEPVMFGWIGRRIVIGVGVSVTTIALALFYLVQYSGIDVDVFRITGFGSGEVSSANSRVKIFERYFVQQFSYNPILGNTQVDSLTTGAGSYVHSLLSIATHLGLVGIFIFGLFLFQMYREITQRTTLSGTLHTDRVYALFRLFSMGLVLLFCLLTAFYTWLPLWFAIGLFGIGFDRGGSKKSNIQFSVPTQR